MLRLDLQLRYIALVDGQMTDVASNHDLWLIADQDCDLAWRALRAAGSKPFLVELRPVFEDNPPSDWGVRAGRFLLNAHGAHLTANSPVLRVSPDVAAIADHVACLTDDHRLRLKTWMGLRYDRPAVPDRYMNLAKTLADALTAKKMRPRAAMYRDVLAQYWDDNGTTMFSLVAVLPGGGHAGDSDEVVEARNWLADAVRDVPAELGVAVSLEAYGDDEVSLQFIEGSFSVDVSKLSWPRNAPGPVGAT